MNRSRPIILTFLGFLLAITSCSGGSNQNQTEKQQPGKAPSQTPAATPVTVASAIKRNFPLTVSGPGKTTAFEKQNLVAPFSGLLMKFNIASGDQVKPHQIIGEILSENSAAALEGARQMLKSAHSSSARKDAERALKIAKQNAVPKLIRAGDAGLVISIAADEGTRVSKDQLLASVAPTNSIGFLAQIDQSHLAAIHAGLPAIVKLSGEPSPIPAHVHAVLPSSSPNDLNSPVRINFHQSHPPTLGVFGTAQIKTGEHFHVLAVPQAAIIRNDVQGITRVAIITQENKAHWIKVKTGISEQGWVEIQSPELRAGQKVIVDGQVGLPEGARVKVRK